MKTKIAHEQDTTHDDQHDYDPIRKTFKDTPSFNRLWLTSEKPLTVVQFLGFSLLSCLMLFVGLGFARIAFDELESTPYVLALYPGGLGGIALCLASLGFVRIVKDLFRK